MKFTIRSQDLRRALSACNDIAPTSSAVAEEKSGVLLRAKDKSVVFMSSDDTSYVSVEVPAEIQEPGEALVRASTVYASVAATFQELGFDGKPNFVSVSTTDKDTLRMTGANRVRESKSHPAVRSFPLLNAGFFPETPTFDAKKATQFPVFAFRDGLAKVSHAASKDPSKLHFNCVQLSLTDDEVIFAATDGIQIAEFRKATEVKGLRGSFILGLKFAAAAEKLTNPNFDKELENFLNIDMYAEGDLFYLRLGGVVLVGTLIKATFPRYEPHMRSDNLFCARFPREDFLVILAGMQPTADAKSHRIIVDANTNGTATISTSSGSGEAESTGLDVETIQDFNLNFDLTLLQSAVRQLKGDTFEFYFEPEAKGVLLKSPKDDEFKAFVCTLKKVA